MSATRSPKDPNPPGAVMSYPSPATLYRAAAAAGVGSAVVLLINAAKRAEVIPTTAFTQLVAPLAQILALALITGLYLAFGRRAGRFGLVAYLFNAFALVTLVGVEFVINLVFAELPTSTIDALRDGPLGIALTVASISFLIGTIAFAVAMIRTARSPRHAVGDLRHRGRAGVLPRLRARSSTRPGAAWRSPSGPAGSAPGSTSAPQPSAHPRTRPSPSPAPPAAPPDPLNRPPRTPRRTP